MQPTSMAAYESIKASIGKMEFRVYHALIQYGPMTNEELSVLLKKPINEVTGRTRGLVLHTGLFGNSMPLVENSGMRRAGKSGKTAIVWQIVENL